MNAGKTVGLGLGAIVTGALATCHIVQAAVLGMLGGLGLLPFLGEGSRPLLVLTVLGCTGLAVYGVMRVRRGRQDKLRLDAT